MKTKKTIKQIQKSLKEIGQSLRDYKKIGQIIFYDVCFILIIAILTQIATKITTTQIQKMGLLDLGTLSPETIAPHLATIKSFAKIFLAVVVIYYLLVIINYTLFRGLIWTRLMNKKINKKYLTRFLGLNLIWCTGWIALILIGVNVVNKAYYPYLIIGGAILYTHLTTVMHHSFTYKNEIKRSLRKTFSTGIGKIYQFIGPYIYIVLIYIILARAVLLIPYQQQAIGIIITIICMAGYRAYINRVITRIEKKK
jgi:hypothetical protein